MVVVFLAKTSAGTHWSHMTEIEKRFEENKASKFSTGNMDEKSPQDSLMGLMRNMFVFYFIFYIYVSLLFDE